MSADSRRPVAVDRDRFEETYLSAVDDVMRHWNAEIQRTVARHNVGWLPDRHDFGTYLRRSVRRYWEAYSALVRSDRSVTSVCDVGGFWGVWPVTLLRLGHRATMTEALKYFDKAFGDLFDFLTGEGVDIADFDPFEETWSGNTYDAVTLLAVLEHYPHSPRHIFENVHRMLATDGALYVEVPNIAYWPWRMKILRGESPLAPIADIYDSAVPFTGHHHEFSLTELHQLMERSGFETLKTLAFTYSVERLTLRGWVRRPLYESNLRLALRFAPTARETLAVLACPARTA